MEGKLYCLPNMQLNFQYAQSILWVTGLQTSDEQSKNFKRVKNALFSVCKKQKKSTDSTFCDSKQRLNITLTHRCCDGGSRWCWDDCQSALEAESCVGKWVNFLLRSSVWPQGIPWSLHPLDCWVDIPYIQIWWMYKRCIRECISDIFLFMTHQIK